LAQFRVFRLIGMELRPSYHGNLSLTLLLEGYKVLLINPLLISNTWRCKLRKTKTDKKDAVSLPGFFLPMEIPCFNGRLRPLISDLRDLFPASGESLVERWLFEKSRSKQLLNITFRNWSTMVGILRSLFSSFAAISSANALRDKDIWVIVSDLDCGNFLCHKREALAKTLIRRPVFR